MFKDVKKIYNIYLDVDFNIVNNFLLVKKNTIKTKTTFSKNLKYIILM